MKTNALDWTDSPFCDVTRWMQLRSRETVRFSNQTFITHSSLNTAITRIYSSRAVTH